VGYEFGASGGGVDWTSETDKFAGIDSEWEFAVFRELGRDRAVLGRESGSNTVYSERERRERGELLDVFSRREHARGWVRGWRFESLFHA